MDFTQADEFYNELKQKYEAGILTADAFDEALRENMVQDDQDRWWAKSRETGKWHYFDEAEDEWIQADPPGYQASTTSPSPELRPLPGSGVEAATGAPADRAPEIASAQMDRSGVPDQRQSSRFWVLAGVIAVALLGLGLGAYLMSPRPEPPAPPEGDAQAIAATSTAEPVSVARETATEETVEAEPTPSPTPSPSAMPTETPTTMVIASPTPSPSPTPTAVLPPPSAQGMVEVNISTYTTTVPISDELPLFWIDQYEVTNSQYAVFVKDTGVDAPDYWAVENIPAEKGDHPVEGISWQRATEYCRWVNKRLPTEAEWEVAARGPHGWVYPWGNDSGAVQLPTSGTYAVGRVLANRSFFGAYDMAGNVWEWVSEPYLRPDRVESGQGVIRGGSATYPADLKTPLSGDPDSSTMSRNTGIRCAAAQVAKGDEMEPVAEGDEQLTLLYTDDFTDLTRGWPQVREKVETYFYGYHPTDFYHV
ncbi:MAG: SUMF1/EgtB/PvdO family nonheme iron enzyme, partial [Anaerolineae bacterium]